MNKCWKSNILKEKEVENVSVVIYNFNLLVLLFSLYFYILEFFIINYLLVN